MIYAQIKSGLIENTIVLVDTSLVSHFSSGFDYCLRIDNLSPIPGIGWSYDGTNFSAPVPVSPTLEQIVEGKIQNAIAGFNQIMIKYAADNVLLGITQYGKTQLIADTLADVMRYGQSGSLVQAIAALQAITITSNMAPFLTSDVVTSLIAQAQAVLNSL